VSPTPAPRRRGLLITVFVLAVLVVLGGGGAAIAYVVSRGSEGTGNTSATTAAQSFLEAIYVDQNAKKAEPMVCSAARDSKKIEAKVNEIKQQDKQYESPKYTWNLHVDQSDKDRAVITATVTLNTANVQKATQKLKLTLIRGNGWFVCEVQQV